jgi:NADH dehydrogenase
MRYTSQAQHIVIVGAGYAGLGTAVRLARRADRRVQVHLVDGRPEHQLITRLHEVAAGRLTPAGAAIPLDRVLDGTGVGAHQAWVEGVDLQRGEVRTSRGRLEYDSLVLAPGSAPDFRDVPGATEHTLPLRTLEDAQRVRTTLRRQVERAANAAGVERRSLLTFLIVGAGYTGLELAGELASSLPRLAQRFGLGRDEVRIGILEATESMLPGHARWLARCAAETLEELGVELFLCSPVLGVDAHGVRVDGGRIRARTVIWTTGIRAPTWLAEAGLPVGRAGRALVDSHLAAVAHPEVAVLGDAALAHDRSGFELPPSAQVAVQQAEYVTERLLAGTLGGVQRGFEPHVIGEALSLGPDRGLARVGAVPLVNGPALLVKKLAHVRYLESLGGPQLSVQQLGREHCPLQTSRARLAGHAQS